MKSDGQEEYFKEALHHLKNSTADWGGQEDACEHKAVPSKVFSLRSSRHAPSSFNRESTNMNFTTEGILVLPIEKGACTHQAACHCWLCD